jgi:Flp pilus assembly pilin Flp
MRMKVNGRQLNAGISSLIRFLRDEEGQNLIEYALIAGLIVSLTSVRTSVASVFNKLGNVLTNAL